MSDVLERDPKSLDKLILGVPAIAAAVQQLEVFDQPLSIRDVERRLAHGHFPASKFGGRW